MKKIKNKHFNCSIKKNAYVLDLVADLFIFHSINEIVNRDNSAELNLNSLFDKLIQ